jgi:hypothetical protein
VRVALLTQVGAAVDSLFHRKRWCPSGDFLIPWNHLDSMDGFLILDSRGPPVWTDKNQAKYNRDHLRYQSDLTEDEWAHVEPLIPPARRGGGKRRTDMRAVMNGVMYILSAGCQWAVYSKRLSAAQHVA